MHNVVNALLNMILVSIPEDIFIVLITLIFLKRFDLLDIRMWKQNIKWIMIPVVPVALIINFFRYIVIIPKPIISLISLFVMNILIIYIIVKSSYLTEKKQIFKTIMFTLISFVIVGLIEILYYPILLQWLQKEMSFFDQNILYNLLITIPARVIQICIVAFIIIKKNNTIRINIFDTIIKNKFLANSFAVILIIVLSTIIYATKLMMIDNILIYLNIIDQLVIVIIILTVPIILITMFLIFVNYILLVQKQIQQTYENLIIQDDVTDVEN